MQVWRNWQTRMVQVHVKAISWRFKSSYPHQTVEIRTLYQLVKGSDFYYISTILTLIVNLNSIKALAFFCKCFSNLLCNFYQMHISLSSEILTNQLVELQQLTLLIYVYFLYLQDSVLTFQIHLLYFFSLNF